jgi:membrane-bound lytic murein transglycosylase A
MCAKARGLGRAGEVTARRFFETGFRLEAPPAPGLLTAYFAPVYEARRSRGGDYTAPVRPRPADLPVAEGRAGGAAPYADRDVIEARSAVDALAWMRPEELFMLQVQGSGTLIFGDGRRMKARFDGTNAAPYLAVGAVLRQRGLIGADASAQDIAAWLAAHRGEPADAVMRLDRRYVFFRLEPDEGADPVGAAGLPLIAGRSIAVDPAAHPLGELFWIDASSPGIAGALATYRRLAVALDTGGAIKGAGRADLYLGRGAAAGLEAGRVRQGLFLYRLAPAIAASP